ncbi:hypothetical protein Misp06_01347 [Microbulbifer sp. NBRC 101763]
METGVSFQSLNASVAEITAFCSSFEVVYGAWQSVSPEAGLVTSSHFLLLELTHVPFM